MVYVIPGGHDAVGTPRPETVHRTGLDCSAVSAAVRDEPTPEPVLLRYWCYQLINANLWYAFDQ